MTKSELDAEVERVSKEAEEIQLAHKRKNTLFKIVLILWFLFFIISIVAVIFKKKNY